MQRPSCSQNTSAPANELDRSVATTERSSAPPPASPPSPSPPWLLLDLERMGAHLPERRALGRVATIAVSRALSRQSRARAPAPPAGCRQITLVSEPERRPP